MRVLKPGGCFVSYEWCLTDKYNKSDKAHVLVRTHACGTNACARMRVYTHSHALAALEPAVGTL
eukprot:5477358-Pleurochrysis_carterae.AAC.2